MAIPVIIVTGFLGCGKTSFLRHLLPLCGKADLRPALIINEVGDVDVDGELVADIHAEQVKLVGGCICCTLQAQLSQTVYDILDANAYDLLIIECSGLSDPLDVVNALSAPALISKVMVSHIVSLLDAGRAQKVLNVAHLAKSQISSADIVVLNKEDTIPQGKDELIGLVSQISPHAELHWAMHGDIGEPTLLKILTDKSPSYCPTSCSCDDPKHEHHSHELPASFCTVAIDLPENVERAAIQDVIDSLPENVIRAKGFAHIETEGWHILHKVYETASITPLSGKAPSVGTVLICIGQHLQSEELKKLVSDRLHPTAEVLK